MKNYLENKDEKNIKGLMNHIKGPTLTVKKLPKKNHGIFQLHVEKKIQNTIEGFYLEVHENKPGISVTEVFINNVKMDCSDKLCEEIYQVLQKKWKEQKSKSLENLRDKLSIFANTTYHGQ